MPSLSSSPWILGAPHSGFSILILRIRSRTSLPIRGRPPRGRDFHRQKRCRSRDLRPRRVSPDYPPHLSNVPCPLPRRTKQVHASIASLSAQPSPPYHRVGVHITTFEACSGFSRVTARWIARPPE